MTDEPRLKALNELWDATRMDNGDPLPDTATVNVQVGQLRVLLAGVEEAKQQLGDLLAAIKHAEEMGKTE